MFRIKQLITTFLFIFGFIFSTQLFGQIQDPIKWKTSSKVLNGNEVELTITATLEKGWHLYSQNLPSDDGPIATEFIFPKSPNYELVGKVREPKAVTEYDKNFDMILSFFKDKVNFVQKIRVLTDKDFSLTAESYSMVCNDEMCLPPESIEHSFKIKGVKKSDIIPSTDPKVVEEKIEEITDEIKKEDTIVADQIELTSDEGETITKEIAASKGQDKKEKDKKKSTGLLAIFIAGFLGGLIALLTPCVFPMIPLTVSFFTKQSKTRAKGILNAWMYGLFIILIYVSLGMIITVVMGPDALNALASNVWMNLIFFVVFIIFAISFLGAFEITLPTSWVNKADSASDKGGWIGIFFMAFTLSLVSFSCTGPIIGTLLVEAAVGGNYLGPAIGMLGFALALALPFGLFAAFPGWLNSLPKSGGWLNSVKVVLGFIELALAFKFLSNVDLAYHWGILTREVFLAIWIVVFALAGFYLLGKLKLSHDSDLAYISVPRVLIATLFFTFVVYLIPGMFGAPLKIISGFPPPQHYNEGWTLSSGGGNTANVSLEIIEAGADPEHCPHNLPCFHDYKQALAYAKKVDKPLLVDFTGYSCVNCRKMEDNVWSDPKVLKVLQDDYILVSLYVDDKTKLPDSAQYVSPKTGKKVKTIGNKWSDMQTTLYETNSQPLYVLIDHNEELLADPVGYTPDIDEYFEYLDKGVQTFKGKK